MAAWTKKYRSNLYTYDTGAAAEMYKAPDVPEDGSTLVSPAELADFKLVVDGKPCPTFTKIWIRMKSMREKMYPDITDMHANGMPIITRYDMWEIANFMASTSTTTASRA